MYGGSADIVPMLGAHEAEKWIQWCEPLLEMRTRDLARIPKPVHLGYTDIEYGARIGIKRDENGAVIDKGFIHWHNGEFAREFAIETALDEDGDGQLWTREIININSIDIDETWLENDDD